MPQAASLLLQTHLCQLICTAPGTHHTDPCQRGAHAPSPAPHPHPSSPPGHASIVTLHGAYEDKANVHLALELCKGGELFDAIVSAGKYSEKQAAAALHTMLSVVAHCHDMGVIHRDLKPENFLLTEKGPNAAIKATDFGLSVFFKEDEVQRELVGGWPACCSGAEPDWLGGQPRLLYKTAVHDTATLWRTQSSTSLIHNHPPCILSPCNPYATATNPACTRA
jgi:serine/threonine protein kinase